MRLRESIPVTERLQDFLHPWTSYLIVPVFALANAGVAMSAESLGLTDQAKVGVLAASVIAAAVGSVILVRGPGRVEAIGRAPRTLP